MKFKFSEDVESLDEATFSNIPHLQKHYEGHVLKDGEQFSNDDPKFPPMTRQEYADQAEALSLKSFKEVHSLEELQNARGIVGWRADNPNWTNPRCIKIDTSSTKVPGYMETVAYVDDAKAGNNIFTYMVQKRSRKYREFASKVGEIDDKE